MSILSLRFWAGVLVCGLLQVPADADSRVSAAGGAAVTAVPSWAGVYEGVVPAADCPGILIQMTLGVDGSFKKSESYLERDTLPCVIEGKIDWIEEGRTFVIHDPYREERFELDGDKLYMLDAGGKRVTGELAGCYVLHKAGGGEKRDSM